MEHGQISGTAIYAEQLEHLEQIFVGNKKMELVNMDFNRELWADAYKFYQQQVQLMERSRDDLPTYFCNLAQEITRHCAQAESEAKELWTAVYTMLEKRAKQEGKTNAEN